MNAVVIRMTRIDRPDIHVCVFLNDLFDRARKMWL